MTEHNNFIGKDGFLWFYGVVEDRQDPYMIGRVKVRCFGHHTDNKITLPTEDLPWAQVMLPVTSAGISGIGQTPMGLVEGSHVFGFFRDGEARQEPVVMGSLPGYPTETADKDKGFYDPNGEFPRYKNAPDTCQLATMIEYNPIEHASLTFDNEYINNLQNIGTASIDSMQLASAFISKGSSSLFGFVADIITSQVASALGSNILNTVGGSLAGFTTSNFPMLANLPSQIGDVVEGVTGFISETGEGLLTSVGLTPDTLSNAAMSVQTGLSGVLDVDLFLDEALDTTTLKTLGATALGVDTSTGQFKFNITNPDIIKDLVSDPASIDEITAFQAAKVALADKSVGVTPQDLGVRSPIALVETIENQSATALEGAIQVASTATGGAASLVQVVDKVTGVTSAIVDDEYQDSRSAKGVFGGSEGIPQKNTLTKSGKTKLMNNFLGSVSGTATTFSVPQIPQLSDTYPKKHVYESESGHIMMYDDNPGNETIMQRHMSGTQYNIAQDGTKTDIVVSDHIHAVTGSKYIVTTEDEICSIDGRCKLFINKSEVRNNHYDIVIGKGANVNIQVEQGDINMNAVDGRINMNCAEDFNIICGGEFNIISQGDFSINSGDDITLQGDKIFLN